VEAINIMGGLKIIFPDFKSDNQQVTVIANQATVKV